MHCKQHILWTASLATGIANALPLHQLYSLAGSGSATAADWSALNASVNGRLYSAQPVTSSCFGTYQNSQLQISTSTLNQGECTDVWNQYQNTTMNTDVWSLYMNVSPPCRSLKRMPDRNEISHCKRSGALLVYRTKRACWTQPACRRVWRCRMPLALRDRWLHTMFVAMWFL